MSAAVPASALISVSKACEEYLPTGVSLIDQSFRGLPRGAVTELTGGRSSGKTSLLYSILAQATSRLEYCAVIDSHDAFDPASAVRYGVDLNRLVWVRCHRDAGPAIKATDLILHGGGFGVVCLDLSGVSAKILNRIPISYWWRFRRAVENTPTVFIILGAQANAKSCASCWLDFQPRKVLWSGRKPFRLLRGLEAEVVFRKVTRPRSGVSHVRMFASAW
jgi:hypothetical protein